jgi:hypothetical protein
LIYPDNQRLPYHPDKPSVLDASDNDAVEPRHPDANRANVTDADGAGSP